MGAGELKTPRKNPRRRLENLIGYLISGNTDLAPEILNNEFCEAKLI
jgi:hypothetical protein